MKILVGSEAARHWWPEYREPNDIDYLSPDKIRIDGQRVETFWHSSLEENLDLLAQHCIYSKTEGRYQHVADPNFLYTLKVSHSFWALRNGSWKKHMFDINWMQENGDVKFVPEIYDIFYPIWSERYGSKKAKLDIPADQFFTNSVDRIYDHDSIHRSIAYYDEPLFTEILKDGAEVMVDWSKFEVMDYERKIQLVREEIYATALERRIIPDNYKTSARTAYNYALMKTITSFWKGKWSLWVVLHFSELKNPADDYVQIHLDNRDRLILL